MRISIPLSNFSRLCMHTTAQTPKDCVACGSEADPEPVPGAVLEADCPYPELKLSVLQSFQTLAESYRSRQRGITERMGGMDR